MACAFLSAAPYQVSIAASAAATTTYYYYVGTACPCPGMCPTGNSAPRQHRAFVRPSMSPLSPLSDLSDCDRFQTTRLLACLLLLLFHVTIDYLYVYYCYYSMSPLVCDHLCHRHQTSDTRHIYQIQDTCHSYQI